MNIIILGVWGGFLWSCFRVATAIAVGVAVGVAVAAIASAAGLNPIGGAVLGIGAGIAAGAIAYSLIGPYQEQTPSSPPPSGQETVIIEDPPHIEIAQKEVVVSIRFKEPAVKVEGERCPSMHFYCEIKEGNDWKPIQGESPNDMLDQVRTCFKEIEKQRASDKKVVNNKRTETFFTINVYKKPFPGDDILSELWNLKRECFNAKDKYHAYDMEYSEPESEGDNK